MSRPSKAKASSSTSAMRAPWPGPNKLAASMMILSRGDPISSSRRRAFLAELTTLAVSGSTPNKTSCRSAILIASRIDACKSCQASALSFCGCDRHISSGSRVPVQRVTIGAPNPAQLAAIPSNRRSPSRRRARSGSIMLNVPDTAATVRLRRLSSQAAALTTPGSIFSGRPAKPAQAKLNCTQSKPQSAIASSVPARDGRTKVLAKIPRRIPDGC